MKSTLPDIIKRLTLTACLLLSAIDFYGQFEGLDSYYSNRILQLELRSKHVRCVTELASASTYSAPPFRLCFDTAGRVIEMNKSGKMTISYNPAGKRTRMTYYENDDTSKVKNWTAWTYDDEGHLLTEENMHMMDGQPVTTIVKDSKIFTDEKGAVRVETYRYYQGKVKEITYTRDSVSGIYHFSISSEYAAEQDEEEKESGLRRGRKKVKRSFVKDNCYYNNELEYEVFGRIEVVKSIKSRYHQTDTRGRQLESGRIDYEKAYMKFMEEHPEDFNMEFYSSAFVKALLAGKISGTRTPNEKCTYDARGRLITKTSYGSSYRFRYDAKDRLTEQVREGHTRAKTQLWYDERGMIIRMKEQRFKEDGTPDERAGSEATYTYSYY